MRTIEELIQQIRKKHPEVSKKKILESFEVEKEKTGGLISDRTLLSLIAARYGIKTIKRRAIRGISIKDLVAGLNDVTVTGLVVTVYPPKNFEGERSGKVANLIIADENATLNVVLWNNKVDTIESGELKVGQVVRFSHGYTRKNRKGKVELHMGIISRVLVNPENIKVGKYSSLCKFITKVNEVNKSNACIHLMGTVKEVFPVSPFTRSDNSTGKYMRLSLADETGEIPIVAWNEKAEALGKIAKVNSDLKLVNAKVKEKPSGKLEIHINSYTYFEVSDQPNF